VTLLAALLMVLGISGEGEVVADGIYRQAAYRGVAAEEDRLFLVALAFRESGLNEAAIGDLGEQGLFQIMGPGCKFDTASDALRYAEWGAYEGETSETIDLLNPWVNTDLAIALFQKGLHFRWSAAPRAFEDVDRAYDLFRLPK
jgi:hypothetical protein